MFKPLNLKNLKYGATIGLAFLFLAVISQELPKLADGKFHLVFCNVGQGDALYLKTPKGQDILIDGGASDAVIKCLNNYLTFWNRKIEIVFLTHPQADHLNGLISVFEKYEVENFYTTPVANQTRGFERLVEMALAEGSRLKNLYTGQRVKTSDGVLIEIVWPKKEWLAERSEKLSFNDNSQATLGVYNFSGDLNSTSMVTLVSFEEFDAYLGGDADIKVQDEIIRTGALRDIEVFKVPHHGSKWGFTEKLLEKLTPEIAVISVGKNRYGHPNEEIISRLNNFSHQFQPSAIKILRTDQDGTIEIVSDGQKIWLNTR